MKKQLALRTILILAGVIIAGSGFRPVMAHPPAYDGAAVWSASGQQDLQTPAPSEVSPAALVETPEARQLPPVGSNAGLLVGASLIVLIIIGGVLGTRRRANH